eukprot:TRINITY_DN3132_c0_g5_i1.p5 TRINITY_DN3132_c0_g5~~TRINITY_DN3132_c0_g5_i1.p5  ORF type:complete len:156 (-),score=3.68 TRINITY_DN3132_c0_g5_i1:130-597(-)
MQFCIFAFVLSAKTNTTNILLIIRIITENKLLQSLYESLCPWVLIRIGICVYICSQMSRTLSMYLCLVEVLVQVGKYVCILFLTVLGVGIGGPGQGCCLMVQGVLFGSLQFRDGRFGVGWAQYERIQFNVWQIIVWILATFDFVVVGVMKFVDGG